MAESAKLKIDGDEASILRSMQRVVEGQERINKKIAQGQRVSERAAAAGQKNTRSMFTGAMNVAKGYLSAAVAVGTFTAALRSAQAEKEKAAGTTRGAEFGLGALSQLAGGSEIVNRQLISAAKTTFREGGARSLDEAAGTIFQLSSAGALRERKFFSDLFGTDDPAAIVGSGAKIQAAFGARETGTFRQITSKGFAAAGPVAKASPSSILQAASTASDTAKRLGLSDEELIAAVSVAAQRAPSTEQAGTQINSLLTALLRQGFAGKGTLQDITQQVQAKGLDEPALIKFLGRTEAAKGFGAVSSRDFPSRLAAVSRANVEDLGGAAIRVRESRFETALPRRLRAAEAEQQLGDIVLGAQQQRRNIRKAEVITRATEAGEPVFPERQFRRGFMGAADVLGADPDKIEEAGDIGIGVLETLKRGPVFGLLKAIESNTGKANEPRLVVPSGE